MPTAPITKIDPSTLSDDLIQTEWERRGFGNLIEEIEVGSDYEVEIREMFEAFKLGKTEKAMEIAKQMAQDLTGGIL